MSPNLWHRPGWLSLLGLLLVIATPPMWGQTLRLSAAAASPGERILIELSIESPAGKEPLGLQWDTRIPAPLVLLNGKILPGDAATQSGKRLTCAQEQKTAQVYALRCLLTGGQTPLRNGTVAVLQLQIPPSAQPAPVRIRAEQALAVSRDAEALPLQAAESIVNIRK